MTERLNLVRGVFRLVLAVVMLALIYEGALDCIRSFF